MEQLFKSVALPIALVAEAAAVLIVAYGVIEALLKLLRAARSNFRGVRKQIWLGLAVWLLLGLEFELAADIVRSVISADWPDIARQTTPVACALGAWLSCRSSICRERATSWGRRYRQARDRETAGIPAQLLLFLLQSHRRQ